MSWGGYFSRLNAGFFFVFLGLVFSAGFEANGALGRATEKKSKSQVVLSELTNRERERILYHLSHLWSELDLLSRNEKVDQEDLKKQEREMKALRIEERIPRSAQTGALFHALKESAAQSQLPLSEFQVISLGRPSAQTVPSQIFSDQRLNLLEEQIVSKIQFRFLLRGHWAQVKVWLDDLPKHTLRYVALNRFEPLQASLKKKQRSPKQESFVQESLYQVFATAYQFRIPQKLKIQPKDPRFYLPPWAKLNETQFQKKEPKVWEWVKKIDRLAAVSSPWYRVKSRFYLNHLRLNFYLNLPGVRDSQ
ncbi:MAG: hypothetical protein ACO3A2_08300 [Bdellovibrionia bacterium]